MAHYIDKDALVAELERLIELFTIPQYSCEYNDAKADGFREFLSFLNTLEVKDPYGQIVQYSSIKDGIQAHAETYSFNIESKLFPQLTKEQQKLWREEIEEACISGSDVGYLLAKDPRYKENLEEKEVDLTEETDFYIENLLTGTNPIYTKSVVSHIIERTAKHFFQLGLKTAQKGE